MTASKPEVVAWMWRDINGDVQFNYMHPNGEELISLADHERLQAEAERLQAERAADKYLIDQLYRQRDDYAMHNMAVRQCTGIPRSVGISEPVEGFEDRPQDLAPAMREMALIIEADKARIAELEAALRAIAAEVDGNIRECVRDCVNQRGNVQDIYEYCDRIDSTVGAALSQQGKEGET